MSKRITIITNHYVRELMHPEETRMREYCIGISDFNKRLDYLEKRYSIIDPELFIKAIRYNASLPEDALLLTFDDGYIDHYDNVFPILKKKGIKAFFFPSAMPIYEKKLLPTNKIQMILDIKDKELLHYEITKTFGSICSGAVLRKLEKAYGAVGLSEKEDIIWSYLEWQLPRQLANKIIDHLFNKLINKDEKDLCNKTYMSIEKLMHMKESGMHIGCHGYRHYCMSYVDNKTKMEEINESLKLIKLINGSSKDWVMCYPYGAYDKDLISLIKKKGCIAGLTTKDGMAELQSDSLFALPRVDISNSRFSVKDDNHNK